MHGLPLPFQDLANLSPIGCGGPFRRNREIEIHVHPTSIVTSCEYTLANLPIFAGAETKFSPMNRRINLASPVISKMREITGVEPGCVGSDRSLEGLFFKAM